MFVLMVTERGQMCTVRDSDVSGLVSYLLKFHIVLIVGGERHQQPIVSSIKPALPRPPTTPPHLTPKRKQRQRQG